MRRHKQFPFCATEKKTVITNPEDHFTSCTAGSLQTNNSCATAVASWPSLPLLGHFAKFAKSDY